MTTKYHVHWTIAGSVESTEFDNAESAADFVRDAALSALTGETPQDHELTFDVEWHTST